jgi:cysteinyl-tRNA synthetase
MHNGNLDIGQVSSKTFERMKSTFLKFVQEVLGLKEEKPIETELLLEIILESYREAKAGKNYEKVDSIRNQLKKQGIVLKDMKTDVDWAYEE